MSDAELRISLQLDEANRKLDALTGKFNTAAGAGKKLADQNTKNSKTISKNLDGIIAKVGGLGAAYLTVAGATKAWTVAASSAKARDSIKILEAAGGSIEELRKQTKGFVDDATLAKNANLARIMGINQQEFARLANMARAASKLTGESTEFMLESIVKGTARGSKLLLDNLGILVDVRKANKDYAKQLGINVKAMTDEQKKRAFKLAVLDEEKNLTEQVTKAGADQSDVYERAEVSVKNLANVFGELLSPAVSVAAQWIKTAADELDRLLGIQTQAEQQAEFRAGANRSLSEMVTERRQRIVRRFGSIQGAMMTPEGQRMVKAMNFLAGRIDENTKAQEELKPKKPQKVFTPRGRRGSGTDTMDGTEFVAGIFGGTLPSDALIGELEETDLFASRRVKGAREAEFLEDFKDGQNAMLDAEAERIRQTDELERILDDGREQRHKEQLARIDEYQQHTATALNIGVDLVMSGMQMFADQEEHILLKLTAMGLARVGNVLIGEGVLAASKGAAYAIESFGTDPRGVTMMAQGAAMIGAGVGMGGASIGLNAHIASLSGSEDSVGSNATSVRTSNSRSTSGATSDGGINLTVVYNGAGPGADEQAKFAASLINRARQMGVSV